MKIFCIIITYNGEAYIKRCLLSILKEDILENYIAIVDNGSKDHTTAIIRTEFPGVILVENQENLGFGTANNMAIKIAYENDADFFFLLNQDVYLKPGVIRTLTKVAVNNPTYGIISPVHLNKTEAALDFMFHKFIASHFNFWADAYLQKPLNEIYSCSFVNAAAWFITRKCIQLTGGFDTLFFHYGEDDEYIQRAVYKKQKIGFCPLAQIVHDRGPVHGLSKLTVIDQQYIRLLIQCKNLNYSFKSILKSMILYQLSLILSNLALFRFKKVVIEGTLLKRILAQGKKINRHRQISEDDLAFITRQSG